MRINLVCGYIKTFILFKERSLIKPLLYSVSGILILILTSCTSQDASPENCDHVHLTQADLKEARSKKILLLIADDRSGSIQTSSQPDRMTFPQYKELLEVFSKNGLTGEFDLRVIGNPAHTGFLGSLIFDCIYETQKPRDGATLTEKGKLRCINSRILDTCTYIKQNNQSKAEAYLSGKVKPFVIDYAPPSGIDRTDIASAFRDIEMKLDGLSEFDEKIVVVMSDGVDSNKSPDLTLRSTSPFELILIGWPMDRQVKEGEKHFNNTDQLINWLKTTIK